MVTFDGSRELPRVKHTITREFKAIKQLGYSNFFFPSAERLPAGGVIKCGGHVAVSVKQGLWGIRASCQCSVVHMRRVQNPLLSALFGDEHLTHWVMLMPIQIMTPIKQLRSQMTIRNPHTSHRSWRGEGFVPWYSHCDIDQEKIGSSFFEKQDPNPHRGGARTPTLETGGCRGKSQSCD